MLKTLYLFLGSEIYLFLIDWLNRLKFKILFNGFHIWTFCSHNVGPAWVKNGKKGYFRARHFIPNPIFSKSKVFNSSPDITEKIFSVSLLKSVFPVLTNQAEGFISRGIDCSYSSRNFLLSFLLCHDCKVLVKSKGGGTFLCLASSVNFQQNFF